MEALHEAAGERVAGFGSGVADLELSAGLVEGALELAAALGEHALHWEAALAGIRNHMLA